MTLFFMELRHSRLALTVWTVAVGLMLGISIFIYPEMSSQMNEIGDMFSQMGSFSDAFGMDQVNFGEFKGYLAVECGNVLGLGGAIFAAIVGCSVLSKEERDRTAEFLLTHPVSRASILTAKLLASVAQVAVMNLGVCLVALLSTLAIGERVDAGLFALLFLSYLLMQIQTVAVTFGVSAFLTNGGLGIGIGISMGWYFLNILSNLTEDAKPLKYLTPFGYADGASVMGDEKLQIGYLATGAVMAAVGVALAYWKYTRKDIQ